MVQQVKLDNGDIHEFPDEATPDQIRRALNINPSPRQENTLSNSLRNYGAGVLNNVGSTAQGLQKVAEQAYGLAPFQKAIQSAAPDKLRQASMMTPDAYKAAGTENLPVTTGQGAIQELGELTAPVGAIGKAGKVGFEALKDLAKAGSPIKDALKEFVGNIRPQKHAKELMKSLGRGSQNLPENSESLVKDIKNAHEGRMKEAGQFFQYPFSRAGNEEIYKKPNPLITTAPDKLKEMVGKLKEFNAGDVYENFKSKPTFENAHKLQSELGDMLGRLEKNPFPSSEERLQIQNLRKSRNELKDDITGFLEKRDAQSNENLSPMYKKGIELYRQNVAPYKHIKQLNGVLSGDKDAIKDIHNIFDQSKGDPDIRKVLADLPESAKDRILFSKVKGSKDVTKVGSLLDRFNNAKNEGYAEYFNPDLKKSLEELSFKNKLKNIGKYVAAGAGGAAIYDIGHKLS